MSLASEVTTWQEPETVPGPVPTQAVRLTSRVRTNVGGERFRKRLECLGLLDLAEIVIPCACEWDWTGTGHGFEIIWRVGTTWEDLRQLTQL